MDAVSQAEAPRLGFGFQLADLSARDGLIALDRRFLAFLQEQDADLHARLLAARAEPDALDPKARRTGRGARAAPGRFVAALFGIEAEAGRRRADPGLDPVHACKRLFVQRQAVKKYPDPSGFDGPRCAPRWKPDGQTLTERASPTQSTRGSATERRRWTWRHALRRLGDADPSGPARRTRQARCSTCRTDRPQHLVPVETIERDGVTMLRLPEHDWRQRDGFALTDAGMTSSRRSTR